MLQEFINAGFDPVESVEADNTQNGRWINSIGNLTYKFYLEYDCKKYDYRKEFDSQFIKFFAKNKDTNDEYVWIFVDSEEVMYTAVSVASGLGIGLLAIKDRMKNITKLSFPVCIGRLAFEYSPEPNTDAELPRELIQYCPHSYIVPAFRRMGIVSNLYSRFLRGRQVYFMCHNHSIGASYLWIRVATMLNTKVKIISSPPIKLLYNQHS